MGHHSIELCAESPSMVHTGRSLAQAGPWQLPDGPRASQPNYCDGLFGRHGRGARNSPGHHLGCWKGQVAPLPWPTAFDWTPVLMFTRWLSTVALWLHGPEGRPLGGSRAFWLSHGVSREAGTTGLVSCPATCGLGMAVMRFGSRTVSSQVRGFASASRILAIARGLPFP